MIMDWTTVRDHRTLYVDDHLLVIDKPAGIGLTGERHGTDLMRQAREAGDFVMPAHRIDKVTSGVVLLARDQPTHGILTRQFSDRTVIKDYLAIVRGTGLAAEGEIDLPLSIGRKSRVRIAADREAIVEDPPGHWTVRVDRVFDHVRSYPARTGYRRLAQSPAHTVLALRPYTGRRHQLRVQLAWIGHPIEGDPLFEKSPTGRTCLHARGLTFSHPTTGEQLTVTAEPDDNFWEPYDGTRPDPPPDRDR